MLFAAPQTLGSNGSCTVFHSFRVFLLQMPDISGIAPMHQGVDQECHHPWKTNANLNSHTRNGIIAVHWLESVIPTPAVGEMMKPKSSHVLLISFLPV